MAQLSHEEINHIALLARLALSPAEREREARELGQLLEHFSRLNELDTAEVEPTDHVLPVTNVLRHDAARPGLALEDVLANAPEAADGMFQVPRVVEAE